MDKKPWTDWRVCGIFAPRDERNEALQSAASYVCNHIGLDGIVYLRSKSTKCKPLFEPAFYLENMSSKRSTHLLRAMRLVTPRTLLILDDIETIRNYPQSMTRNIINFLIHLTQYKITGGGALVTNGLDDLYAEFAVLDKKILHTSHYWCFIDDHREVDVFDGKTIRGNKEPCYLADKLRPFIHFNLYPNNEIQEKLYSAVNDAHPPQRVHDIASLRLQ